MGRAVGLAQLALLTAAVVAPLGCSPAKAPQAAGSPNRPDQGNIVTLASGLPWGVWTSAQTLNVQILPCELARQGFLMAAREELALRTRDGLLGERLPAEAHSEPFALVALPEVAESMGALLRR